MDIYWIFIFIACVIAIFSGEIDKRIPKGNFMFLGTLIGAVAGLAIVVISKDIARFALSLSVCPLVGMFVGMLIKKR
ncbi:MAG: hypothetical protein ACYDG2_03985 [Ruminiclostridium sp.]